MSLSREDSVDSICIALACKSEDFLKIYNNKTLSTDSLYKKARVKVIEPNREYLRNAHKRYRLDDLLSAMLEHAPHPDGRRYVAVALLMTQGKGEVVVANVARAWMDYLLLPMLTTFKAVKTEPTSSQTPTIEETAVYVESASRSEQRSLRAKVASRELYFCAITKAFDQARARALGEQGRGHAVPDVAHASMETAHIIPFLLNDFKTDPSMTTETRKKVYTWDMLRSWTRIDIEALAGPKINSPANAIYMTNAEHERFGRFELYFDKETYPDAPNKYRVRMTRDYSRLSNGKASADVEFRTLVESGVEPPNPEFLKIHAAFAKVLNLSAAAEYVDSVERDAERNGGLRSNGETDLGLLLMSRLAVGCSRH